MQVLEEHNIEPVVINEAVGRNLQDHPFSPMVALLKEKTDKGGVRAQVKYSTGTENLVDDMMIFAAVLDPATMNIPADTKGRKALMMNNLLAKPHSVGWVTLSSAGSPCPAGDPRELPFPPAGYRAAQGIHAHSPGT